MNWHTIGIIALSLTVIAIPMVVFGALLILVYLNPRAGWTMVAAGVAMFLAGLWTIMIIPRGSTN